MSDTARAYLAAQAAAIGAPLPGTGFGGLIPYFDEFVPRYLRKKDGKPIGKRAAQIIAKENNLPLVRLGNNVFIDVEKAAERLREAQIIDREPRGRGRPAKRAE